MQKIELDPECVHEGCHLKGTVTICLHLFLPASEVPYTYYFNAAICEYHRQTHWTEEHVKAFIDANWEELMNAFGLGLLADSKTAGWSWVPWIQAVEYWSKLAAAQSQNPTQKTVIH